MPVYPFVCKDCKKKFEIVVSEYSVPIPSCPKCKSGNVKRLWNVPTISFNGSGFYSTGGDKSSNG